ncbi:MAG: BamA/TamA family outer membrane protein [Pseudomonadales bacterium]
MGIDASISRRLSLQAMLWLYGCISLSGAARADQGGDGMAPGAAGLAPDCVATTDQDVTTLATYQFEAHDPDAVWDVLPPDADFDLGEIAVVRQDVFEQPENWFHRAVNRYHLETRERVILSVLPVMRGDHVRVRDLREAERVLRAKSYLYDARIIPRRLCGRRLDVYVVTRDVWTLNPRLGFDRSGGENRYSFGLSDSNVAGTGSAVSLGYENDVDRSGIGFRFTDPNVHGSRWALDLGVLDNSDGGRRAASLRRPFYALDARWAAGLTGNDYQRDEGLYFVGDKLYEYQADSQRLDLSLGWSPGRHSSRVHRFVAGLGYERDRFDLPPELLPLAGELQADDRKRVYPYVAYQQVEDDFDTRMNFDRVQRTEDVALGRRLYVQVGYSSDAFGGASDELVAQLRYSDATWLTTSQLLTLGVTASGYYDLDRSRGEDIVAEAEVAYRLRQAHNLSLLVRTSVAMTHNPSIDTTLMLGGETGLRGFPNRFQSGDRRFLVTLEERYYADVYPLQMFRIGAAVFVDVGRAWYSDAAPPWVPQSDLDKGYFDTLSDVGIGLRLESTRTRRDRILHVDLGFPLQNGPGVRGVELTLSVKQTL